MDNMILIGAGGHSKVIQDIVLTTPNIKLYAVLDEAFNHTIKKDGLIYANTNFINEINQNEFLFCIAIGNNNTRKNIFERLSIPLQQYAKLIHPSAVVSNSARIGNGTVVMPNAVINADTRVGNHCIVNTGSVIEHDNAIGSYVHVSPNATLSGTVTVEDGTHIGAGATVIPGKSIGTWATVGAGAVVIEDIESYVTAVGVPAVKINTIDKG